MQAYCADVNNAISQNSNWDAAILVLIDASTEQYNSPSLL